MKKQYRISGANVSFDNLPNAKKRGYVVKKTSSLIANLMIIIMAGFIVISVLMLGGFTLGMRINSKREIKLFTIETTEHLRNRISARLNECSMVLDYSIMGAVPFITSAPPDTAAIQEHFRVMKETHPDVQLVFGSSVGKWTEPGNFMVYGSGRVPASTYDNTIRSWHVTAIGNPGHTIFTEPYIDTGSGEIVVSLVKAELNNLGRMIGVVGIDISMNALDDMANMQSTLSEQKDFIIHPSGKYLSNSDHSLIMEKDFFEDNGLEHFRDQALSPGGFYGDDGKTIICSVPISISGWTLVSIMPRASVYREINRVTLISIAIGLSGILIFLGLFLFVFTRNLRPIKDMSRELKEFAEGDLRRTIQTKSRNEIGELARYFNTAVAQIKTLVINIRKKALDLSEIGNDLASDMNETSASVTEITANIQSIKNRIMNQSASVSETHATMEQIVDNIRKLSEHVESQSAHISQASSAIEEMVANINSVTDTLIKNSANVKTLREASEIGRAGLVEVSTDIREIASESEGLLEINSVMENISSQTNLLSMNAAIEAAHAGESGKGFAVVADEIRKLAKNSGEQSKTISSVLKKIKESIDKITRSTENVLTRFEAIDASINVVAEQEENIRHAMEEQGIGSRQILDGVANVNEITRQVMNSVQEMNDGAKEVMRESKDLERVTQEISSGMNEMAEGAEQINKAVRHTSDLSIKNNEDSTLLQNEVSRFKIE